MNRGRRIPVKDGILDGPHRARRQTGNGLSMADDNTLRSYRPSDAYRRDTNQWNDARRDADDIGHERQDAAPREETFFDDGAPMQPEDEAFYDDPPHKASGKSYVTAIVLIGCAMVGTAGAYGFR